MSNFKSLQEGQPLDHQILPWKFFNKNKGVVIQTLSDPGVLRVEPKGKNLQRWELCFNLNQTIGLKLSSTLGDSSSPFHF